MKKNFNLLKQVTDDFGDERANRYALKCLTMTIATLIIMWVLNAINVFIVEKKLMTFALLTSLGIYVLAYLLCYFIGLSSNKLKYILMAFIVANITVVGISLTYHIVILMAFPIIYSIMYSSKKMTFYSYGLTVLSIILIVYLGYFFGLCDANMALLTYTTLNNSSKDGAFLLTEINDNPTLTLALYYVLPRVAICSVLVPVCLSISNILIRTVKKAERYEVLSKIDGMTGLFNKSMYLSSIKESYFKEERVGVIFWDVNRLKYVNDNYGHEYGDKLIISISKTIQDLVTDDSSAYRIGGDEFIIIIRNTDDDTIKKVLTKWEKDIELLGKEFDFPISASVGFSCGEGVDLDQIVKEAEEMMYKNKDKYHKDNLLNR